MKSSLHQINLTLEQREALELRAAGATFDEIAHEQGVNKSTAKRRVDAALDATLREPADELRELEAHRLDRLWTVAYQIVANRDARPGSRLFALDRCLAVSERRSKLLGLDAPTRREDVVHVITEDAMDAAIRQLEADLGENDDRDGAMGVPGTS